MRRDAAEEPQPWRHGRAATLLVALLHSHPFVALASWLHWARHEQDGPDALLSPRVVGLYVILITVAILSLVTITSVFYTLAYRWPLPVRDAAMRRQWGVVSNLFLSDLGLFGVQLHIVFEVGFASGLQAVAFLWVCVSFAFSAIQSWVRLMRTMVAATEPDKNKRQAGGFGQRVNMLHAPQHGQYLSTPDAFPGGMQRAPTGVSERQLTTVSAPPSLAPQFWPPPQSPAWDAAQRGWGDARMRWHNSPLALQGPQYPPTSQLSHAFAASPLHMQGSPVLQRSFPQFPSYT
eukprot:TRINITY_DN50958_c0_g1_i1.p1 TRINITY_DN50958_c0_g1~~TRINITY_DN50958_c0_g1_i1.p1  ORF type:complete len:291 (+),score=93.79 TRINITY_DN50958_c0_g1_i1:70-942(+)